MGAQHISADAALLVSVPLFATLGEEARRLLAGRIDRVRFAQGETIFHHGDPGDSLYVVIAGRVELFIKNDVGERFLLETATAGSFFGELSLLDGGPRQATAQVVEAVEALEVDRGDLEELLRLHPQAALDLLGATGRRLRESNRLLRRMTSRNANLEFDEQRSLFMKVIDWIAWFSGSMPFLVIHVAIFAIWIVLNLGWFHFGDFDPFPFGLLTMAVSLEAIILSVFVLLSQNRQVERDRVRNDIEYQINYKAELEVAQLHEKVDLLREQVLAQLGRIERGAMSPLLGRGVAAGDGQASPPPPTAA